MPKKIIYIVSHVNKSLAFEWVVDYLDSNKFELVFILMNPYPSTLEDYLVSRNIRVYRLNYRNKRDLINVVYNTFIILKKEAAQIVHAHLLDACLVGLIAAFLARVPRRIHTRHNSTFHHLFFPKAVWYDKLINALSTEIVSISDVVTKVLVEKEGVNISKIHLIHHGFVFEEPESISNERTSLLIQKYNLTPNDSPIIGVISRFISWKGIQYIIPAFQEVLKIHTESVLVLANGQGSYEREIKKMLSVLPEKSYRVIVFEEDVFALYKLFDVFVHVPIDSNVEAFGQTYVESLSMKVPSIFTLSGIANEFVRDRENAIVVDFKNTQEIYEAIEIILADNELAIKLAFNGQKEVCALFGIDGMINKLEKLYES